jgi:hypothetical protein
LSEPVTKSPTAAPVSNRVDGSLRLTLLRRRCACRYVNCFRLFIDAFQSYRPLLSSILDEAPRPSCSNCTCRARAVHDPSCGRACWPLRADAPPASARRDRSGSADGSGPPVWPRALPNPVGPTAGFWGPRGTDGTGPAAVRAARCHAMRCHAGWDTMPHRILVPGGRPPGHRFSVYRWGHPVNVQTNCPHSGWHGVRALSVVTVPAGLCS